MTLVYLTPIFFTVVWTWFAFVYKNGIIKCFASLCDDQFVGSFHICINSYCVSCFIVMQVKPLPPLLQILRVAGAKGTMFTLKEVCIFKSKSCNLTELPFSMCLQCAHRCCVNVFYCTDWVKCREKNTKCLNAQWCKYNILLLLTGHSLPWSVHHDKENVRPTAAAYGVLSWWSTRRSPAPGKLFRQKTRVSLSTSQCKHDHEKNGNK